MYGHHDVVVYPKTWSIYTSEFAEGHRHFQQMIAIFPWLELDTRVVYFKRQGKQSPYCLYLSRTQTLVRSDALHSYRDVVESAERER